MKKGSKQTPKSIEKMRQVKLGKKDTPETIEKKRLAQLSPETLERNRLAHTGKKDTPETIERKRLSHLGNKNGFFGRKHSVEYLQKMSEPKSKDHCRKLSEAKKGIIPANIEILKASCLGKSMSESHYNNLVATMSTQETRDKMSIAQRGENNPQWRGGVTPLYKNIRECAKYYEWRDAVYKRDDYCDVP
jgi:hypothetical protein